jgi:hypothetical protein
MTNLVHGNMLNVIRRWQRVNQPHAANTRHALVYRTYPGTSNRPVTIRIGPNINHD